MHLFDRLFEQSSRSLASRTSRRGVIAALAQALTGAALLPLLPVDRGSRAHAENAKGGKAGPEDCEYWKYCAIDGFLCACCGGTATSCPPGTGSSPITWVGTCRNPGDGRDYIVSYNDCCGKASCGTCDCNRNEREKPLYRPSRNNDLNWCMANANASYHCTVSVIVGVAEK